MPLDPSIVEPRAAAVPPEMPDPTLAAPAPAPEEAPAAPEVPQIPADLLKVPAFQGLVAGAPPAVSMDLGSAKDREEATLVATHKDVLLASGFGFYRSNDGKKGVLFNSMKIHPEDLVAADKAGKLDHVAPDFDTINHEISKLGDKNPILHAGDPTGLAARTSGTPPQTASGQLPTPPQSLPPSASPEAQRKLAMARVMNMQPGAPTSGPEPGAGRILNNVLKPVI
jgi:hypothetical protein